MKINCDVCGRKYEAGFAGIRGSNLCPDCLKDVEKWLSPIPVPEEEKRETEK